MKDQYIAAKERWAWKMAGQARPAARSTRRLPPGQREVHNFPVLDLGIQPEIPLDRWELKIHGQVENPVALQWPQFLALPQFKDVSDFHCVTTWSQFDMEWEGVAFFTLADLVKPKPAATHVFFKSYDGYSTNNPLEACLDDDVLIPHRWNGKPLPKEHGGPATRGRAPSSSAKSSFSTATSSDSGKYAVTPTQRIRGRRTVSVEVSPKRCASAPPMILPA